MREFQIGKAGVTYSGLTANTNVLRAQFDRQHYLKFSEVLEPALLEFLQLKVDEGEFYERVHDRIASNKELCMTGNSAFGALLCLINDARLFQIVQDVTECDQIRCFEGRVYRVSPGQGHHDSWHNDVGESRLVGMSINLSKESYSGGVLEIREADSKKIVSKVANVGSGDAVIFRLSPDLQHRVTEVKGTASKTAFAGWFKAQPSFAALLRQQSASGPMQFEVDRFSH